MAILSGDIKFVASTVMDDVPEGGGGPTGHVIVDGESNEIFSDISEVDRAGGAVSLRKVFVAVETANTDTYLDANVIVSEPPDDPNVSVTLMSTGQTFDDRDDARNRVEAYLFKSSEWPGFLLENHVAGQRVIQIFQRPSERVPNIGETFCLVYLEGVTGEREQYVRVTDTSVVIRTYINAQGNPYSAAVVSLELSDALRFDLPGTEPNEYFKRATNATKFRETSVADAATYCGVARLADPVSIGHLAAKVESVFTQLVPSARTEIPLVDTSPAGSSVALAPAGDGTVTYTTSAVINSTTGFTFGNPVQPGTLSIVAGSATLYDQGGQIFDGATAIGVIDYARGTATFPSVVAPYSGSKTVTFKVAAAPTLVSDTGQIPVTQESRAYNYIMTIFPPPAAGSVMVSYRAQERWYDLRDDGSGVLKGLDAAYGVGTVNYSTGTAAVTLGALPDDGSSILFHWGTKNTLIDRSGDTVAPARVAITMPDVPLEPGTVVISWNDGSARSATDDGKGAITGDATGSVNYKTGEIRFVPSALPQVAQEYSIAASQADESTQRSYSLGTPTRNGANRVDIDLGYTNITPGTLRCSWVATIDPPRDGGTGTTMWEETYESAGIVHGRDDGNGNLIDDLGRVAGTVDYAAGTINFQPDGNVIATVRRSEATQTLGYAMAWAG